MKLHNAIIDLHALDAGILAGQEPCIDFKQKVQTQELKYAYMKKVEVFKDNNSMQQDSRSKRHILTRGSPNIHPW